MNLSYRPVVPEDFEFLFRLHEAAMRGYVEDTFGPWEEAFQRDYFQRRFDPTGTRIIRYEEQEVGVVRLQERTEETFLAAIEILPAYQRRGIGTAVMRALLEDADRQGKPVALQVLKVNIPARSLYQRLGFGVTGENATHYIMAYYPRMGE